eukprot:TRINITY_DN2860_c0_g1_i1.p1 TRINITY_DN2860_c0_g1~~TRINITY_DN2860_c0_g1_i1.p1  ORF type:complete len:452 (+),score=142.29 TRINITY_DN2860_c0_g1_i1:198-1358(+)
MAEKTGDIISGIKFFIPPEFNEVCDHMDLITEHELPPIEKFNISKSTNLSVRQWHQTLKNYGSKVGTHSKVIVTLNHVPILSPQGCNRIAFNDTFFRMYGETSDFRISYDNIQFMYFLNKPRENAFSGNEQGFFVLALKKAITRKSSHTNFIVIRITDEKQVDLIFNLDESDKNEDEEFSLLSKLKGETYSGTLKGGIELLLEAFVNKTIIPHVTFLSQDVEPVPALECYFDKQEGYLYPLPMGFFLPASKPFFLPYKQIDYVQFKDQTDYFEMEVVIKGNNRGSLIFAQIPVLSKQDLMIFLEMKEIKMHQRKMTKDGVKVTAATSAFAEDNEEEDEEFIPDALEEDEEDDYNYEEEEEEDKEEDDERTRTSSEAHFPESNEIEE